MSSRCTVCSKKLTLVQQTMICKCKKGFCDTHRPAETHSCTYNFKEEGIPKLEEVLLSGKCIAKKIDII